jgi:hypothetical protein
MVGLGAVRGLCACRLVGCVGGAGLKQRADAATARDDGRRISSERDELSHRHEHHFAIGEGEGGAVVMRAAEQFERATARLTASARRHTSFVCRDGMQCGEQRLVSWPADCECVAGSERTRGAQLTD